MSNSTCMIPPMAKYAALQYHLERSDPGPVSMTFQGIADLVGGLPTSASRHRAWWANDRTHTHARAWLEAGRTVADVDLARGRVRFSARASGDPLRQIGGATPGEPVPVPSGARVVEAEGPRGETGFVRAGDVAARVLNLHPGPVRPGRVRHRFGDGPFARLRMPWLPEAPGVYLWELDGEVVYVGKSDRSIRDRLGPRGYSTITDYNTLAREPGRSNGGQQTNCRVNALANAALAAGGRIEILFRVTEASAAAAAERAWMQAHGVPEWNARDER